MANDPTKIDWSQLDDLTFQSEATPVETDAVPLWRDNTTGMLYTTIQDIIDLVPDPVAALSGGLDARDDLTSLVDGERTSWMLSVTPASQDNLLVVIGNAVLTAGYSLSGDILTLVTAPAAGTPLVVYILSDPIPGTAGGSEGNVQYKNSSNALAGEDGFDYNPATNTLTVENVTLSGTIDGRDPSVDGGVLDNIVGGAYSLDDRYYTETEVDDAIAAVSGVTDGDKGDVTVSASGATWTIDNNAVSYAKLQDVSAESKLLGRGQGSGAGDPVEITLGANITMTGTTLNVSSGTATLGDGDYGDVTVSGTGTVITIDNDVVTNAKSANMATTTIKGRASVGTGDPEDLTATQVRTILNVEDGATADQTPAEIVAATNSYLGQTDWQSGGSGGGAVTTLWASKVESVDVPGGGFAEVVLTNATGATPTGYVTGDIEIPTGDDDVSAWARITDDGEITIRVTTIGPDITVSGTWKVSFYPKTSYSWFSSTENETVGGSAFAYFTVPAVGVTNANHIAKFIYLPTTSAKLKSWATVGTDEIYVTVENTGDPDVLLDGDVEVVTQLKSAAFPVASASEVVAVDDYTALIASTEQTNLVYMKCYTVDDDGGGGWFEARESGPAVSVDYGHVMPHGSGGNWRFHRLGINQGVANVCHFGANGSGDVAHRTANTTAFQRAVDYLSAVSAVDYNGGYALIVPKGKGEFYIDGEITVPTTVAELHIMGIGRVTISQYTDGTGIFVFTKNQTGTPTSLHRFVLVRDITFSWFSFQQLADSRANAVMLTNAPDGSAGHTFGFTFEQCKFERGRCGFTLIKTGDASWTDAETDAWTAGGFVQTVCFDKCSFYYMSGGAYYVSDTSAGGPQLLFRNINSTHGYTSGGRVKILEREFIYVNHAQVVTIDDLEFLMSDRALIYCGNSHNVKLTQIAFEFYNMADQSQAMRFNGADTFFTVDGIRVQNSTFPADRWIIATYRATGRVMGSCLAYNNTSTTGRLYFCGRYAADSGTIGWDANAKFTANNAVCAAADNTHVTTWAPSAITNT